MNGLIDRKNFWVMFCMFLFFVTKVTAIVCGTIIALKGNIWIGSALFVCALVFRITWTYIPDPKVERDTVHFQTSAPSLSSEEIKRIIEQMVNSGHP